MPFSLIKQTQFSKEGNNYLRNSCSSNAHKIVQHNLLNQRTDTQK